LNKKIHELAGDELFRYEHILASHAESTGGLSGLMAAAAKHVRRNVKTSNGRDAILRHIAAGVIAPLQFAYVLWILRRAREREIDRLYFLSRDGQSLLRIARQLAGPCAVDCELRYLYASRQAFNRAVAGENSYEGWLWQNINERTTTRELLDRIGVTPEQISDRLERSGFDRNTWSDPIAESGQVKLKAILQDESVRSFVKTRSQEKRGVLLRYLRQEKVLEGSSNGCVDIGWNGSAHSALSSLLNDSVGKSIHGFHFGLTKGDRSWEKTREAYFFDLGRKTGYQNLTSMSWGPGDRMIVLIETFCPADHGSVCDFVEDGGAVEPVLRLGWQQIVTDWGLPIVRKSVDVFTEYLSQRLGEVDVNADVRAPLADLLTEFWSNPTTAEAAVWGSFPVEAGQGQETHLSKMAAPFHWSYPFRMALPGFANPRMDYHWRAASLRLSGPLTRSLMRLSFGLHDRMKSRPRWKQPS
jgi:hypothetical protein